MILTDDGKRQRYDATGEIDDGADMRRAQALELVGQMLGEFLGDDNAIYRNLVEEMKRGLGSQIRQLTDKAAQQRRAIDKAEKIRGRFKAKKGQDIIGQMIEAQIAGARNGLSQIDARIEVVRAAVDIVGNAEFSVEPMPSYARGTASSFIYTRTGA